MEDIVVTEEIKLSIAREIARLSKAAFDTECVGCKQSFLTVINALAGVLYSDRTIKQFLEFLISGDASPSMVDYYLDLFDI